jgi:hypothetical protein
MARRGYRLKFDARGTILDAVKLAVGITIFTFVDPAFKDLSIGWLLSLAISVALTIALSYGLLNQSTIHVKFVEESTRLQLTGPTADMRVTPHGNTEPYALITQWSGHGPLAERIMQWALSRGGFALHIGTQNSLAYLVHEKGDGSQPRRDIYYSPDRVATSGSWTWSVITLATDHLPESEQVVGVSCRQVYKSWFWGLLRIFVHIKPDVTEFRLVQVA